MFSRGSILILVLVFESEKESIDNEKPSVEGQSKVLDQMSSYTSPIEKIIKSPNERSCSPSQEEKRVHTHVRVKGRIAETVTRASKSCIATCVEKHLPDQACVVRPGVNS